MTKLENTTRTYFAPAQMTPEGLWVDDEELYHFNTAEEAWDEVDCWRAEESTSDCFVVQVTETRKVTRINKIREWQRGERFKYNNEVWEVIDIDSYPHPDGWQEFGCFKVSDPYRYAVIVFSPEMEEIDD